MVKGTFIIWCEDEKGNTFRAKTYAGNAIDGITAVQNEGGFSPQGYKIVDIWARPKTT